MPHTPLNSSGTSGNHPLTPGGPPSVSSIYNENCSTPQNNNNNNQNANHASPASHQQSPQHKSNIQNQNLIEGARTGPNGTVSGGNPNGSGNNNVNGNSGLVNLTDADLNADLINFDPAAVIDGDNTNDLNVSLRISRLNRSSVLD